MLFTPVSEQGLCHIVFVRPTVISRYRSGLSCFAVGVAILERKGLSLWSAKILSL
jgi:hypothetical protein